MKRVDWYIDKIVDYLRDQEFSEEEFKTLLRQVFGDYGEKVSDLSVAQFTERLSAFKSKREIRLIGECMNVVIPELNGVRRETCLALAQDQYKVNRKSKHTTSKKKRKRR